MHLVIAEKPSAARNFAKALGGASGSYGGTPYRICALRGHLLGLLPPDRQVPEAEAEAMRKWSLEALPWNLSRLAWEKGVLKGSRECLDKLKAELERADIAVIATDVDPSGEGELLAWEALEWAGWDGPVERMYFADEAPKSVQRAFKERKRINGMLSDGDFLKAWARERWDFGSMQLTRAATCVAREAGFREVVRQGRLKSVIVEMVGDQLKAHASYVRKPYFEARFKDANGNVYARRADDWEGVRFPEMADVDLSCLRESGVEVDSRSARRTAPGRLLDLAGMSAILAKKGHKPDAVLRTYQKMYEDQVVSYPRTEDKKVTPEQFAELLPLADKIAGVVGVDASLLTHREPRKAHVAEGGAHGANRPGPNVPGNLEELEKYGKEAAAIYGLLAKNYLATLCEDYEYEHVKGHVADFPDYVGEARIPRKPGFKAVFDSEAEGDDGEEDNGNAKDLRGPARPFVHEGANKRPPKPTMKWLNKRLEKYNVGTGATRTSTLAEITKSEERALMRESKGALTLTRCGEVSYLLLEGCRIASPEATEELFEAMERVGRMEADGDRLAASVTDVVVHDVERMRANKAKLAGLDLGGDARPAVGKCPRCGADMLAGPKSFQCSSNRFKKNDDGKFELAEGCGFSVFRTVAGKRLTDKQGERLLKAGRTGLVKGLKGKRGKSFEAYITLDAKTGKTSFEFPEGKGRRR